ncbi:MAG: ATP-binding cassette domain-containing protein [Clostridia bacterium]|nr:ATP-binding cassette domain-containing protein [Clostridia bacterium]
MVDCENLVKIYKTIDLEVLALQGLDLSVEQGELMAIIGNSGSGKSTLLNMLGGLDRPSAGRLIVDEHDLLTMPDREIIDYKRETVGFVWQNNARNLIPYLTALENVEMPLMLCAERKRRERALELLDMVGLADRRNNRLQQLSGGEQQRVAIAIALANRPRLLLADEPTGAVDTRTAAMILDLFRALNRETGITIIIVTHDRQLSRKVDRVVAIRDGKTSSEFLRIRSYAEEMAGLGNLGETGQNLEPGLSVDRDTHTEVLVMDRAARVQIPKEFLDGLGLTSRDRLLAEREGDRLVLRPYRKPVQESPGTDPAQPQD